MSGARRFTGVTSFVRGVRVGLACLSSSVIAFVSDLGRPHCFEKSAADDEWCSRRVVSDTASKALFPTSGLRIREGFGGGPGGLGQLFGRPRGRLGSFLAALEPIFAVLARPWASLGRSWVALGRSWAALGCSWAALGLLLAALCSLLVRLELPWGPSGSRWCIHRLRGSSADHRNSIHPKSSQGGPSYLFPQVRDQYCCIY